MATFDQLSAEQRAIVELILKQGKGYDDLADMLALPRARVRELARDALVRLAPVSATTVDDDWRAQLADYLLNQQTGPEATATRGHLRRSEPARGWARSVLDSLDQFYRPATLPTIPAGDPTPEPRRDRRRRPRSEAATPGGEHDAGPAADSGGRLLPPIPHIAAANRRTLGGVAGALLVLVVVLIWPIGLLTGDDEPAPRADSTPAGSASNASGGDTRISLQLPLAPVESLEGREQRYNGIAAVAENGSQRQLVVRATLPPTKQRQAYQVWLYNSDTDVRSLGAQTTEPNGLFEGLGPLPEDFRRYKFVDISREPLDRGKDAHSGDSVLRGSVADFTKPTSEEEQPDAPDGG